VHSWLPLAARRTHNLRLRLPPTSDPGNWAVSIEAGSRFGYQLVWVVVLSNLIAIQLQTLAARLGLVTGKNLAQVPAWAGGRVEGRRTAFISVLAAVAGGAGCASHGT
jgi:manganese transport protein